MAKPSNNNESIAATIASQAQDRVSKLEDLFHKEAEKLSQLRVDHATLRKHVENLPSKGFIIGCVISAISILTALIVFVDKIQKLLK